MCVCISTYYYISPSKSFQSVSCIKRFGGFDTLPHLVVTNSCLTVMLGSGVVLVSVGDTSWLHYQVETDTGTLRRNRRQLTKQPNQQTTAETTEVHRI